MKLNNSNLDYWKMSDMSLTDNLNIAEMNCASRDCRDCDCNPEEDEGDCNPEDFETDRDVNGDW